MNNIQSEKQMLDKIKFLYGDHIAKDILEDINALIIKHKPLKEKMWVDEKDVVLITYGDSIIRKGENTLRTLDIFLKKFVGNMISAVHLLPMFPYTSDDGFSVIDYKSINPDLGTWNDINELANGYDLMFDAVINHISKSSEWFKGFLNGEEPYKDYFIDCNPKLDYAKVVRPRVLPLLTDFETKDGKKYVWTTFSEDQIDLNYKNPRVLLDILDILITYAMNGARYIRLDAIGFVWKDIGTRCIHLEQTHILIKLFRDVLEICAPGTMIITETNVPHEENISYFGNGYDEAHMVYQFALPPLVLFSFHIKKATKLMKWANKLENTTDQTTYFNFLASHDGIGMRPTEGILTEEEKKLMVRKTINHGGFVSFKKNGDGTRSPYELNINYQDALTHPDKSDKERIAKFLASQSILLSFVGVPGIYIHSLIGSRNWTEGVINSGIKRRINRQKLYYDTLLDEIDNDSLRSEIFKSYLNMLNIRSKETAFSPKAKQSVVFLDERIFSIFRFNERTREKILVLINVSDDTIYVNTHVSGIDLFSNEPINNNVKVHSYQVMWIKL